MSFIAVFDNSTLHLSFINRDQTYVESDGEKLHVEYHKNNNKACSSADMMDGLAWKLYTEVESGYVADEVVTVSDVLCVLQVCGEVQCC